MPMIEINWRPSHKELRVFAALQIVFFGAVAGIFLRDAGAAPYVLMVVSLSLGLLGLAAPRAIRWFYVAWMAAVFPIGWAVTHLLMAIVFFGLIMPVGLAMRLAGRDPLERKIDREAPSYWDPRPAPVDARRYFKQY
ncbi:MAG: hypothetical protein KY475_27125 [Planctomycetes bacterium]|nr:hypothetical protein [Planctomycetota bacterium]